MFEEFDTTPQDLYIEPSVNQSPVAGTEPVVIGTSGAEEDSKSADSVIDTKQNQCGACLGTVGCLANQDIANVKDTHVPIDEEDMSEGSLLDAASWCLYCCCA